MDIILYFLDMDLQHLQLGVPHPPELPVRSGVVYIVILSLDCGGVIGIFQFSSD